MKNYLPLSLPLLLVLPLAATGCGKPAFADVEPAPFESVTYNCPLHDFSLKMPVDWECKEPGVGPTVMFLSPPDAAFDAFQENVNVVVNKLRRPMTTEQCFTAVMEALEKTLRGFTLESHGPVSLGSIPAMAGFYRVRADAMAARLLCYVVVHHEKCFVITCAATESRFDAYQGIFAGIAKSLRFN
jgi:hypothetical protein